MQYVCSLRTILKICAKYAQFAHNPQDKKKRKKKVQHWCFQCGMVSDTYSYSRRPFICAATLPKVSVLIICNGNSSMSWVNRSGSFKCN